MSPLRSDKWQLGLDASWWKREDEGRDEWRQAAGCWSPSSCVISLSAAYSLCHLSANTLSIWTHIIFHFPCFLSHPFPLDCFEVSGCDVHLGELNNLSV